MSLGVMTGLGPQGGQGLQRGIGGVDLGIGTTASHAMTGGVTERETEGREGDRRQGDKDKAKVDMETTDPRKLKVGQRLSEEQRDELSKQKRCFYCFKEGHNRENCPARKSRERK
jgi:hypothetical protein